MKKMVKRFFSGINPFSRKEEENRILYSMRIILSAYLIYIVGLLVGEALIIFGSMPFGYNATDRQLPQDILLICSFFGYAIVILAFVLFALKVNRISLKRIGLDSKVWKIFKGGLYGVITLLIILLVLLVFGFLRFDGINQNVNWPIFILFFFAFLAQSGMEEVVCRGYIFHRLSEKISVNISTVISILFFSVFHFSKLFGEGFIIGIIGVLNLILISVIFLVLTWYDKNIYSAIGFHWIWNFMLYNVIGLNLSGIEVTDSLFKFSVVNEFLTGADYGIESSIITTFVCGTILMVIILIEKGKVKNDGIQ